MNLCGFLSLIGNKTKPNQSFICLVDSTIFWL